MATIETWLTAEEFCRQSCVGQPTELVRGQVVLTSIPGARHGWICNKIGRLIGNFVEKHDLGYVFNNDSGIITQRGPDTVRGADVAFYSYQRLPKGQLPSGYPNVAPDLVFEVRSPDDRWKDILAKVAEYLQAGVLAVCVVDPQNETLVVYYPDQHELTLDIEKSLALPEILPGFSVQVRDLF